MLAGEVDDELAEDVDDDVLHVRHGVLEERDALLDREGRLLVLRVTDDPDDDPVEDRRGPTNDVDVPERDGVEGPRG